MLKKKRLLGIFIFTTLGIILLQIFSKLQFNIIKVTANFDRVSIHLDKPRLSLTYESEENRLLPEDKISNILWDPVSPVSIANITAGKQNLTVHYERCLHIPKSPKDFHWAEEGFMYDPPPKTLQDVVDPRKSSVTAIGPTVVKLGDKIKLRIELYDGHGRNRTGRDLVRVWMKEPVLGAGSVGKVTDNMDGSYDAELTAFWVGRPTIRVAVISPREVLTVQFRRKYICPAVLLLQGVFGTTERTVCSYYPQVPGYTEICNLTDENYGRPWYCGKPRSENLTCSDWKSMSFQFIFEHETILNKPIERELLSRRYQTMILPANIPAKISSDSMGNDVTWIPPDIKCNIPDRSHTWIPHPPAGFLYNKQWTSRSCRGRDRSKGIESCVKNLKILMIGDSTVRQIFQSVATMIPCLWGDKRITIENKHEKFICSNETLNALFEYNSHELPFWTELAERKYFKSITSHIEANHEFDGKHSQVVIIIHLYSHIISQHSHILYESLIRMKPAIIALLNANPNASVIIKGPHAFAFQHYLEKYICKPEGYLEVYEEYIRKVFNDVKDRVIYLDVADMTLATEQNHIHPETYIVNEMVHTIFDYICKY